MQDGGDKRKEAELSICPVASPTITLRRLSGGWWSDSWPPVTLVHFVLLVGASHLRSLADGIVLMPEDCYTFGIMSTPGACADQLRTEVVHAVLPQISDAVCVMAPSNNLMASKTPRQGGIAFGQYLATVCSVWPTAQVHPSDDMGMPILVESLLAATKQHLEIPAPKPRRNHSEHEHGSGSSQRRVVYHVYRLVAYRVVLEWALRGERLGPGNRRVLPSCIVTAIRNKNPSPTGTYKGFMEADDMFRIMC
ncbi:hypothetical protein ABVT39_007720 [Epinephelus coioides]